MGGAALPPLWLFSSDELVCFCVYCQFIALRSHLRLLGGNWLGSGLGRLVALEVSFPDLLWSFPPQNNLLNTEADKKDLVALSTFSVTHQRLQVGSVAKDRADVFKSALCTSISLSSSRYRLMKIERLAVKHRYDTILYETEATLYNAMCFCVQEKQ